MGQERRSACDPRIRSESARHAILPLLTYVSGLFLRIKVEKCTAVRAAEQHSLRT